MKFGPSFVLQAMRSDKQISSEEQGWIEFIGLAYLRCSSFPSRELGLLFAGARNGKEGLS